MHCNLCRRKLGWVAVFWLLLANVAVAGVRQKVGASGYIDWGRRVIRTAGVAQINANLPPDLQKTAAVENARLNAFRHLWETLQQVHVNASNTVAALLLKDKLNRAELQKVLQTFVIVDTKMLPPDKVQVEIEMPLAGRLADLLLPADFQGETHELETLLCPVCGRPWPAGKKVPPGINLVRSSVYQKKQDLAARPTGLIVVASDLGVTPALAAKILDEDGQVIYDRHLVPRELAVTRGLVAYAASLAQARKSARAGARPLIVNAVKADGAAKTDLILSRLDAQKISEASRVFDFLAQGKVVFVIDE